VALSNRDRVGRALEIMAGALEPFVEQHMATALPSGRDWLEVMTDRARRDGRPATMVRSDPRLLLQVIGEHSRAFRDSLSKTELAFAQEIREAGHKWAHHDAFSDPDTSRVLDTIARLLRAAGAVTEAGEVDKLLFDHQRAAFEKETRRAVRQSAALPAVEGMGLKPWREVIVPHPDVRTGRFNASQFAANLYRVAHEEDTGEYGDPVEFFQRTYLTEGLRNLISRAVRRVSGDANAAPAINLQTNFGGGKTHSMLALYHLFSGRPLTAYPQDLQELLEGRDLAAIGKRVRRVTLVGNHLSPSEGITKPDGTRVNTLWGELAWQLGGKAAYDSISEADRTATNPGSALTELIMAYSPCVILIDEWVAYARELFRADLPAGSFDTQFTFAQLLTESVASVPGALLVVSIPASDIEVGGTHGQEALTRLQNIVRRIADQWRPASSQESFEIVRRRLFEDTSGAARTDIAAVARRFTQFYTENQRQFPSQVAEAEYERRIRDCYPLHPELFDRLYDDWSTLERFQRTRGVLRLMSTVIYALWQANDAYPLIMPATIPLSEPRVFDDLTQYLEDSWKSIIDSDVDGPSALPGRVDHDRPVFGQRALTQRLARTIFLGSAATLRSAHKGIDQQRIWLGTAVPGDSIGHFASSLHMLAEQATYLYSDGTRYWYDTQPSVARAAKDEADRLRDRPEEVWAEIVERLGRNSQKGRGNFAAVTVAPEGTGDIPDTDEARLVIVHPHQTFQRNGEDARALAFAREAFSTRGSAQRKHRNELIFLAPDARRMEELEAAVREHLAWKHIAGRAKALDLTPTQLDLATTRRDDASTVVEQRIFTSYIWVMFPDQPHADRPMEVKEIKAENQAATLADRVSERLHREGQLAAVHSALAIQQQLTGPLRALWDRGYVSVGELWDLYSTYPYLPRLRDRSVMEVAVREVLNSFTWEQEGFALATGRNEDTGSFTGLALPYGDSWFGPITDAVLLVRPDIALAQQAKAKPPGGGDDGATGGGPSGGTGTGTGGGAGGDPEPPPPPPPAKTRYFGVFRVDAEKYGRDLTRLQQEILPHLADPETGELTITVEVEATHPDGFTDDKIRILTENARVLKFERSEFD
jgi:predicted AAA+ superfamily ATPase